MERPYEKFAHQGAESLSDAELLAIIVKSGTKDKSSVQLVQELMIKNDYEKNGLSFLNELSIEELMNVNGIGEVKAIQLKAVCELARRMSKPSNIKDYKIVSPDDAACVVMEDLRYLKQEELLTILLNSQSVVMKVVTVSIGGLNKNLIETREIFKEAIRQGADKMILVHNHPSGNPYPSDSDIKMTMRCYDAGKIIGIEVIDHIIIGNGIFCSLKKMKKF